MERRPKAKPSIRVSHDQVYFLNMWKFLLAYIHSTRQSTPPKLLRLQFALGDLLEHFQERLGLLRATDGQLVIDDGERDARDPADLRLLDPRRDNVLQLVRGEELFRLRGGHDPGGFGVAREELVRTGVAFFFKVSLEQPGSRRFVVRFRRARESVRVHERCCAER